MAELFFEKAPQVKGGSPDSLPGISIARISPPKVSESSLVRTRLLEALNEPAPHVTYVIAPSGYGKTTLAAQWAAQHPSTTAWYTSSASDSVLDTVLSIMQSFRNIFPGFTPQLTEERIRSWSPVDIVRIGCNELAKIEETVNLVIDESHVWSEDHKAILNALSENVPDNVRVLMLRATPPTSGPLPAAARKGLVVWGVDDLKFTDSEIDNVIKQHGKSDKDVEFKKKLDEIDGWPLGVYIISTSNKFGNDDLQQVSQKSIDRAHDVFIDHAIGYLPEGYRTLLQKFCLIPVITENIALAISDFPSPPGILNRMAEEGQYISQLGSDSKSFIMNPLIREAFKRQLMLRPTYFRELAKRSAEALIHEDKAFEALELLEIAGERVLLGEVVQKNINEMIFTAKSDLLQKWKFVGAKANVIGPIAVDQLEAYADLVSGSVESTRLASARLTRNAQTLGVLPIIQDDIALFHARILFASGELQECLDFSLSYLKERISKDPNFPEKASLIARVGGASAFLLSKDPELFEIARHEERILDKKSENDYLWLRPAELLSEMTTGDCKQVEKSARIELDQWRYLRGICAPYEAAYSLAEVLREQGRDSAALDVIDKYLPEAISFEVWPWAAALLSKRALVKNQMQMTSEALEDIRTARVMLTAAGVASDAFQTIDMHEVLIRLTLNDGTRVDEMLGRMHSTTLSSFARVSQHQGKEAQKVHDRSVPLLYSTVRAKILSEVALTEANLAYPPVAREHLQKALALGMDNGYREIFLSRSPAFLNLLIAQTTETHTIYLEELASAARVRIRRLNETSANLESPLTKRELEILRNLSTGMTIFEISKNLHISHNTMKTHLKSVYKKLHVDGRETAVAKGKELVLI